MQIRQAEIIDAAELADIYNFYIVNSHSTFETAKIDSVEMERRVEESVASGYPFMVGVLDSKLIGYAYGHCYRSREAYRHSVEISVYVRPGSEGNGFGTKLYESLLPELTGAGFHAIIAGISLPNDPSVKLHERFGFQKVAHFREVGNKFGRWIDVAYWELIPS